jgi:hypothetical protein
VEEADADLNDQIDAAYRTKYRRCGAQHVNPMVAAFRASRDAQTRAARNLLFVPTTREFLRTQPNNTTMENDLKITRKDEGAMQYAHLGRTGLYCFRNGMVC